MEGLAEAAGFFPFFCFFGETQDLVDDLHIGEQHSPAAVPFNA